MFGHEAPARYAYTYFPWIQCSAWRVANSSFAFWHFSQFCVLNIFDSWFVVSTNVKLMDTEG